MFGTTHPTIEVEGFTGPFDLLARLIERRELDVLTISLAEVTEQYLDHLAAVQLRDPEHLSAFLVVAAKLLMIKSSLLLPAPRRLTADEEPSDPTDLTERLREYQQYRSASQWLARRDDAGLRTYARPPSTYRPRVLPTPEVLEPLQLRDALLRALSRPKTEPDLVPLPTETRLTVAEALDLLRVTLGQYRSVTFGDLVGADVTRQRCVALFLAVLEALRQGLVSARQDEPFGEIALTRATSSPLDSSAAAASLRSDESEVVS